MGIFPQHKKNPAVCPTPPSYCSDPDMHLCSDCCTCEGEKDKRHTQPKQQMKHEKETVSNLEMHISTGHTAAVPITVCACSLSECHRSNK